MGIEKDTVPVPSGDPFYDALIKRLWMDDDRTRYYDALYFTGSTVQLEDFKLTDFNIMGLKEAPPIPERNAETRRALLGRGIGCLAIELQVRGEPNRRNYLAVRPAELAEPPKTLNIQYMHEHYSALAEYNPEAPLVFRFFPTDDEAIIDRPLEHPYLREVYDEIIGTF